MGEAGGAFVFAGPTSLLDARDIAPVLVGPHHLILVRTGERVVAADRACPHEGADLALGRCSEGRLLCPRHLAWFDLRSGRVSAGWSFCGLRLFPVERRADGYWVALDPIPPAPSRR